MPATINYKSKYLELRSKYIADLDMAFRLGVEEGAKQAQQQQAIDAQAKAQEMEMQQKQLDAQAEGGQPPQPGQEGPPGQESSANAGPEQPGQPKQPGQGAAPTMAAQPSELDQHITKLEGMLGSSPEPEIQKSLQAIISLRKNELQAIEMKKSEEAIKGITKALHKPTFKLGVQAAHNLTDSAKKAVSLQHKIVNDVMKAWKEEENKASKDIKTILEVEGLIKE